MAEIECGTFTREAYEKLFIQLMVDLDLDGAEVWLHLLELGFTNPWIRNKTAAVTFARLPEVKTRISNLEEKRFRDRVGMDEEQIETLLVEIAHQNAADIVEISAGGACILRGANSNSGQTDAVLANELLKKHGRVIKSIKNGTRGVEIAFHDKKWAFDLLAKQFQKFSGKMELTGADGAPLVPVLTLFDADAERAMSEPEDGSE